jgi:hypothetical protein
MSEIARNAVGRSELATSAVTSGDVANGSLKSADLATGAAPDIYAAYLQPDAATSSINVGWQSRSFEAPTLVYDGPGRYIVTFQREGGLGCAVPSAMALDAGFAVTFRSSGSPATRSRRGSSSPQAWAGTRRSSCRWHSRSDTFAPSSRAGTRTAGDATSSAS